VRPLTTTSVRMSSVLPDESGQVSGLLFGPGHAENSAEARSHLCGFGNRFKPQLAHGSGFGFPFQPLCNLAATQLTSASSPRAANLVQKT
jgi:hypothetical protein